MSDSGSSDTGRVSTAPGQPQFDVGVKYFVDK